MAAQSFNSLLSEFLADLTMTFTEYPELKMVHESLQGILALDPSNVFPIQFFRTLVAPYAEMIGKRDASIFGPKTLALPGTTVDLSNTYSSSDETTQNAIWEYLQQLTSLSMSVECLPPEIIAGIKSIVETILEKVSSGEISSENAHNPLFLIQTLTEDPALINTVQQLSSI
ncbi:FirrV-1-A43 [Feldmannia irregularis virus a]|uniref:FirrV-1-A43 n=1 Tax=Feldmannia irregularis virus a TaxID=231992 RepID=Q6XM44_9PHYC|nr:FirrV-1-A43 [Feldmannia irregularis virus a]AAR26867.1 FirrV-1-A43 [Feldmannia irregularis virus a]